MGKKERMLNHITNNVKWLLPIDASVDIIPYYDMSSTIFSRAMEYLVSGYVEYDDVVCLISTSILEPGKSGILFTTDSMYCKSWGLFTTKYHNYYFGYDYAEFDFHNDFYENRMKELMKDLNDISVDEDENAQLAQKINEIVDYSKKFGEAILGGMAIIDVLARFGESMVSQNNAEIGNEIKKLENSGNQEGVDAIMIYEEFIPLMNGFINTLNKVSEAGDDCDDETYYSVISSLNGLLLELYYQASDNVDISLDDEEEYARFENWVVFWALMFYNNEQFRESYPIEALKEMPENWEIAVGLMDEILEDAWENSFSDIVYSFSNTIVNNSTEMFELMSNSECNEEFFENLSMLVESNNQAVKSLEDALDRATDYLEELLSQLPH